MKTNPSALPSRPILTTICQVLAAIEVVGAVLVAINGGYLIAGAILVSALVHLGIGQAIEYLATTAHFSRLVYEKPAGATVVRAEPASAGPQLPPLPGREDYYVAIDDRIEGPITREVVDGLVARGMVTPETLVVQPGWTQWRPFGTIARA